MELDTTFYIQLMNSRFWLYTIWWLVVTMLICLVCYRVMHVIVDLVMIKTERKLGFRKNALTEKADSEVEDPDYVPESPDEDESYDEDEQSENERYEDTKYDHEELVNCWNVSSNETMRDESNLMRNLMKHASSDADLIGISVWKPKTKSDCKKTISYEKLTNTRRITVILVEKGSNKPCHKQMEVPLKEQVKAMMKEQVKEVMNRQVKAAVKAQVKEAAKVHIATAIKEMVQKAAKEIVQEAAKEIVEDIAKETPEETPEEMSQATIEEISIDSFSEANDSEAGDSEAGDSEAGDSEAGDSEADDSEAVASEDAYTGAAAAVSEPSSTGLASIGSHVTLSVVIIRPAATGPSATVPAATGPSATVPAVMGPSATVPAATGPSATGPSVTVPAAAVPAATGPVATGSAATGSAATGPAAATGPVDFKDSENVEAVIMAKDTIDMSATSKLKLENAATVDGNEDAKVLENSKSA